MHVPSISEKVSAVLLALLLIIVGVYGVLNHSAKLGNDEYNHVTFGRDLANGRFFNRSPMIELFSELHPTDKVVYVRYGGYRIKDGKIFSKIEIGCPMLLAIASRLFGDEAMFFVNPFLMLLLTFFVFLMGRELLFAEKYRNSVGLIAAMLILLLKTDIRWFSRTPLRDIPSLTFLVAATYLLIRSMRDSSKVHYGFFALAVFVYGISCNMRLTNVLMLGPYGLYIIFAGIKRVRFKGLLRLIGLAAVCFILSLIPIFIQNYLTSGNILVPPQSAEAKGLIPLLPGERKGTGLDPSNLLHSLPKNLKWFVSVYHPVWIILILAGAALTWKKLEVKTLFVFGPVLFFLFFNMWGRSQGAKYFIFIHPFIAVLFSYGIIRIASLGCRLLGKVRRPLGNPDWGIIAIITLILILTSHQLLGREKVKKGFSIYDARIMKRRIEALVPQGALILGARYLTPNIDFYTHAYSMNPEQLSAPWEMTDRESIHFLIDKGVPVYIFNNQGVRNAGWWIIEARERFDVNPVETMKSSDIRAHYENTSNKKHLTLYKIEKWRHNEIALKLDTPEKTDYILTLDLHKLLDDTGPVKRVDVSLNGERIGGEIGNDINYFLLRKELITNPYSEFKIKADIELPANVLVGIQPLDRDYFIDIGSDRKNRDKAYVSPELMGPDTKFNSFRYLRTGGTILVPTMMIAGSRVGVKILAGVSLPPGTQFSPVRLHLSIDGAEFQIVEITEPNVWETLSAIVPPKLIKSDTSRLGLEVHKKDVQRLKNLVSRGDVTVKLDWLMIEQWTNDINFKVVPSDSGAIANVLFLEAMGLQENDGAAALVELKVNGRGLKTRLTNGVNRILLPRYLTEAGDELRVSLEGPVSDGAFFNCRKLLPIGRKLKIDFGSDDEAFIIDGFHAREAFLNKTPMRWTRRAARISLPYVEGMKSLSLEIKVLPLSEAVGKTITKVSLNDKEVGDFETKSDGAQTFRFHISDEILETGWNELKITTPVWRPSDKLGTKDWRELGIMLDSIIIGYICEDDTDHNKSIR